MTGFILIALLAAGLVLALWHVLGWRGAMATQLYLGQCDVALRFPRFSNPELMKLDLRGKTADGEGETFECYEWFVARLVYVLDRALKLAPTSQWRAVAETQLANHKHYFASDYYRKQDYLAHYSPRMRKLIARQMEAS